MKKVDLLAEIDEVWTSKPEVGFACRQIVEFLIESPKGTEAHLTFGFLITITKTDNLQAISEAAYFLAADHLKLLTQKFEAEDEYGGYIEVEPQDVIEIMKGGDVYDPVSGEATTKELFFQKVTPYFEPTAVVDRIKAHQ